MNPAHVFWCPRRETAGEDAAKSEGWLAAIFLVGGAFAVAALSEKTKAKS